MVMVFKAYVHVMESIGFLNIEECGIKDFDMER